MLLASFRTLQRSGKSRSLDSERVGSMAITMRDSVTFTMAVEPMSRFKREVLSVYLVDDTLHS